VRFVVQVDPTGGGQLTRFRVYVYAQGEDGQRVSLGNVLVEAVDHREAEEKGIAQLWDDRLFAASCSPVVRAFNMDLEEAGA